MAVTQDRHCRKCNKKVRMTQCSNCKGHGYTTGITGRLLCKSACNQHGWLCPTHGKNY